MKLNLDDFARIDQAARTKLKSVYDQVHAEITRPDTERRDLSEYQALTNDEHGKLFQSVGPDRYREYVNEMERLRKKRGAQGG